MPTSLINLFFSLIFFFNFFLYISFINVPQVHNMFHSEISEARFSIGTGSISNPDKFYILEASSPEKKQEWTKVIKDLLNQQFEMLKGFLL